MNFYETWEKWDSKIHNSTDSKKRIVSAQKAALTPLRLEKEDGYAYFQGTNGRYETFLDYCPCGDFRRRKLPCKHIYRLAMELNLIEGTPESDLSKVKLPKSKHDLSLVSALDIIENCSDSAQLLVHKLLTCMHNGTYQIVVDICEEVTELLDKNIFCECSNNSAKDEFLDKKEIVKLLKELGLDVGIRKTPANELIQLAHLHLPEYINNNYMKMVVVSIDDKFSSSWSKLQKYLKRKFEPDFSFNEDMEITAIYPNDEITALLVSRGFIEILED